MLFAGWNNQEYTTRIINANPGPGKSCRLDYAGIENSDFSMKTSIITNDLVMK